MGQTAIGVLCADEIDGGDALSQEYIRCLYEAGMHALLSRIGQDHPRHAELLVLRQQLMENFRFGPYRDSDARQAERAEILDRLSELALEELGASFSELSGLSDPSSCLEMWVDVPSRVL